MRTDQSSVILPKVSLAPAAAPTGNTTVAGAIIDRKGFNSLTFIVMSGVVTDGTFAGKVYGAAEGDPTMADEVELTGSDLIGSNIAIATSDDGVCERVGVNLSKLTYRYFRLKLTQAGATSGGFISHLAILGNPDVAPTTAP